MTSELSPLLSTTVIRVGRSSTLAISSAILRHTSMYFDNTPGVAPAGNVLGIRVALDIDKSRPDYYDACTVNFIHFITSEGLKCRLKTGRLVTVDIIVFNILPDVLFWIKNKAADALIMVKNKTHRELFFANTLDFA